MDARRSEWCQKHQYPIASSVILLDISTRHSKFSKSTALRILNSLDKKGIIEKKGAGRDASYMLKNKKNQ